MLSPEQEDKLIQQHPDTWNRNETLQQLIKDSVASELQGLLAYHGWPVFKDALMDVFAGRAKPPTYDHSCTGFDEAPFRIQEWFDIGTRFGPK